MKDEIIRMAQEADSGFEGGSDEDGTLTDCIVGMDAIERFFHAAYAAGAAAEREACAKVCDVYAANDPENFADICAAAIRARKEKT